MSIRRLYTHTAARYGRMVLLANDTGAVTSSLLRYGEWAEQEIAFMISLVGEGATVLDVGAYVGTHTLAFSRWVGPSGRVIAFEPQPASYRVLRRNVAFNRLDNVALYEAAVGDQPGETLLQALDPTARFSFGSTALSGNTADVAVRQLEASCITLVTVDSLALDRCDLIKIDVEGMECFVLEGARQTIERHRPWLYAECNSVDAGLETSRVLRSLGYSLRLHLAEAFNPDNFRGEVDNIFADAREAAIVGIPPDRASTYRSHALKQGEMLLEVDTADDLVLGLLNKPQYVDEVLRGSAAATSGGESWLDQRSPSSDMMLTQVALEGTQALAIERAAEIDRISTQLARTQEALEISQALAIERAAEIDRISTQLARTQEALESLQALAIERAAEIDRISTQLARTQEALESLQALAIERAGEIDRISTQLARTQEALESSQVLAIERAGEIDALQAMVETTLHQADIARSLHRHEMEGTFKRMERIASDLRSAQAEADHLSSDLTQATAEAAKLTVQREVELAETSRLALTLQGVRSERDRDRERISSILASTSWRFTRPMRVISRIVRKQ